MGIFQSIVYGIIQGITEFLPISSTAHLILIPYFFHWPDPGLSFDVALHLGTLIAILVYFWKDWIGILQLGFGIGTANIKKEENNYNKNTLWLLVVATIPGMLAGYFLETKAETIFRSPIIIAIALFLAGLLLYIFDKYYQHKKDISHISWADSIIIGISQAFAIIPGVSRSGATIAACLSRKLDRKSAARFSFLLSTPIIFGAVTLKLKYFIVSGLNPAIILGIVSSAVFGYLAIKYLLKFLENSGYGIFFWYRTILAIAIFLFAIFQ